MIPHASNIYLIYGSFVVRSLLVSVLLSRELPTHPHMHSSNTFLEFHHKCVFPLRSSFIAKFLDQLSASAIYNISKAFITAKFPVHAIAICIFAPVISRYFNLLLQIIERLIQRKIDLILFLFHFKCCAEKRVSTHKYRNSHKRIHII